MRTLLFSWDYRPLGELFFEEGWLKQIALSSEGEVQLGAVVKDWQMRGIQIREHQRLTTGSAAAGEQEEVLIARRVLLTNPEAEQAFHAWVAEEGYIARKLPTRLFPHWQKLCQLALEPEERFASLQAMLTAPHAVLQAWDRAMDKVGSRG